MSGFSEVVEVTTDGQVLNAFPVPHCIGITFNQWTGTYLGVEGTVIKEFSTSGALMDTHDLAPFGVGSAVGIAEGQGKIFIADEGYPNNSAGRVHIFRVSGQ